MGVMGGHLTDLKNTANNRRVFDLKILKKHDFVRKKP